MVKCEYCGRFMRHVWFQTNDEPGSWEDYWSCSRDDQHRADYPEDWADRVF